MVVLLFGLYLRLMNPNENVREALRLTQLDSIFEVYGPRLAA